MTGDCLVIENADGSFDLFRLGPDGSRRPIYRGIADHHIARRLAIAQLAPQGRDVFYKDQAEPDSAIRLLASR